MPSLPRSMRGRAAIVLTAVVAGAVMAGCDVQENADTERGRTMFIENCGTCHALAEAGTTAQTGPDLDASFAGARASGMDQDTIEGVVQTQIENPRTTVEGAQDYGNVFMPANLVEGQDAEDVAAYVASVAGVPGIMPPEAQGGPGGQVFADNGCASCHAFGAAGSSGTTGPNLDDVLPGQSKGEIEQSIVDPNAQIAAGFGPDVMPLTYGDDITPEDLKLLVDFLFGNAGKNSPNP